MCHIAYRVLVICHFQFAIQTDYTGAVGQIVHSCARLHWYNPNSKLGSAKPDDNDWSMLDTRGVSSFSYYFNFSQFTFTATYPYHIVLQLASVSSNRQNYSSYKSNHVVVAFILCDYDGATRETKTQVLRRQGQVWRLAGNNPLGSIDWAGDQLPLGYIRHLTDINFTLEPSLVAMLFSYKSRLTVARFCHFWWRKKKFSYFT